MDSQHLDILLEALPPLHRKVRAPAAAALAQRLDRYATRAPESHADPLGFHLYEVLWRLESEMSAVEEELNRLTRRYNQATDEPARRAVLVAHLEETVRDRGELRKDLRALRRWLGFDALRERLEKQRHQLLIEEETGVRCLAGLLQRMAGAEREPPLPRLASLGNFLLARAARAQRVQNRLALLETFGILLETWPAVATGLLEAEVRLVGLVEQEGANPFVQAEALRGLLRVDHPAGMVLLRQRMRGPTPSKQDFLFRRQALHLAAPLLPAGELLPLLEEVVRHDSSEYVRQGVCELLVREAGRTPLLRRLAGLEAGAPEESPRVRACAVLAAAAVIQWARPGNEEARHLLVDVLRGETHPLVLRMACEQAGVLGEAGCARETAHALAEALAALRSRERIDNPVLEVAAAAEQVLRRAGDDARRAWTEYLAGVVKELPVGGKTRVRLTQLPPDLPPLPEDPAWLGAILADLAHGGHGLYARRGKKALTLWHGDRYQRRAWRIWHELRRPAPNKRQAFLHTIGRNMPGELRAHPGRLDEITETLVPGERVHVANQGSWGRHLPTVDDLLDLPLAGGERVHLFSSHGTTTLTPPASLLQRLGNRLRITRDYARLSTLRLTSLGGGEPRERQRFVEHVERELGVTVRFEPYQQGEPIPPPLATLFGGNRGKEGALGLVPVLGLLDSGWVARLSERILENESYFLGTGGNGLGALGLFTAGLFTVFLGNSWRQREEVRRARESIPLCIGGWGTRGKSGTERLKAALFGGLGFGIFAKTTGSEAMFVHAAPGAPPSEFFIFRPYDKATIWEQRDMLRLGASLGVEVFLWECMALQPPFVELLQNDWMHDDVATLTNAYPDHEDIQGPAGIDVASVITRFMPRAGTVVTTEDHFLPLFQQVARERGTRLIHSPAWEAELLPEEVLALFPYREHPRNVALVATLAEQLGVPRDFAIALMAEHVQPEIGVLKVFPPARVRGRLLTFINGHSANERTGFLNNWRRTGLDSVDPEAHPERAVVTVINNRWDRVARSEVFARIMVEDASADRHVLIGTNLEGLQKYVRDAVEQYLARVDVVAPEDLSPGQPESWPPEVRLARHLAHLKIPRPSPATFLERLERYARGAGLSLVPTPGLVSAVEEALSAEDETLGVSQVRERLAGQVGPRIDESLRPDGQPEDESLPEVLAPATVEEVHEHALFLLARLVVHARLRQALPRPGGPGATEERIAAFHQRFREAWRELFLEQLVPVHDARATGDQIVDACARAVPPGMQVSIMGAQNIKGTGLDWVYRWLALDRVQGALEALRTGSPEARLRALESLEGFEDQGFVDAGLARAVLPRLAEQHTLSPEEAERLRRLAERARETHEARLAALRHAGGGSTLGKVTRVMEKGFDYLDSVRRRKLSQVLLRDLVEGRISHARAALEMRKLYERQKGGWMEADLRKLLGRSDRMLPSRESVPTRQRDQELFEQALEAPHDVSVPVPPQTSRNVVSTPRPGEVPVHPMDSRPMGAGTAPANRGGKALDEEGAAADDGEPPVRG
jgi:poly-gamma-glutamate synthase PgsB/CapB